MTKEEIQSVLKILRTYYPQSFKDMDGEGSNILLNLWSKAMEEEDGSLVKKAVWEIINTETREFAPNIAQVRKKMFEMTDITEGKGILPVDEAWHLARSTWSSLPSDRPSEIEGIWEKLPPEIKRIYKPADMVELGFRMTSAEIDRYEKPRFYQQYDGYEKEAKAKLIQTKSISKLAVETNGALMHTEVKQIES